MGEAPPQSDAELRRHELEAAALLLLLIRRARRLLRKAVKTLTLGVVDIGGTATGTAHLDQAIRTGGRQGIATIRAAARDGARRSWSSMTGIAPATDLGLYAAGLDAIRAQGAGDSLARQLHAALVDDEDVSVASALRELEWRLDRMATTEAVDAWSDETSRLNDLAEAAGVEIIETWSAILDSHTCKACRALDGDMVTRPDRFEDLPPLHPHCRCIVLTEIRAASQRAA